MTVAQFQQLLYVFMVLLSVATGGILWGILEGIRKPYVPAVLLAFAAMNGLAILWICALSIATRGGHVGLSMLLQFAATPLMLIAGFFIGRHALRHLERHPLDPVLAARYARCATLIAGICAIVWFSSGLPLFLSAPFDPEWNTMLRLPGGEINAGYLAQINLALIIAPFRASAELAAALVFALDIQAAKAHAAEAQEVVSLPSEVLVS